MHGIKSSSDQNDSFHGNIYVRTLLRKYTMDVLDCACLIHGDFYPWVYVENLYNMIQRNLDRSFRFHVFTESSRSVPGHMIKHDLENWTVPNAARRSWWYKMQMFNPGHGLGPVLYFDLDVVIAGDISFLTNLDSEYFWALKDFKRLWRPGWTGINSSVMYWDNRKFGYIWEDFKEQGRLAIMQKYHGDQDYLSAIINSTHLKYLPESKIRSWRWEIKDMGWDFKTRNYRRPNTGTLLDAETRIMIFHGHPKPHEISDPVIDAKWK